MTAPRLLVRAGLLVGLTGAVAFVFGTDHPATTVALLVTLGTASAGVVLGITRGLQRAPRGEELRDEVRFQRSYWRGMLRRGGGRPPELPRWQVVGVTPTGSGHVIELEALGDAARRSLLTTDEQAPPPVGTTVAVDEVEEDGSIDLIESVTPAGGHGDREWHCAPAGPGGPTATWPGR